MTVQFDTPLLTVGQVQAWEARREEVRKQIEEAQKEFDELTNKLDAASVFVRLGASASAKVIAPELETPEPPAKESVGDAIVRAAKHFPSGAPPADIKAQLAASGFDMTALNANLGYFYTVLGRLVQRGKLERRRNGHYRVPAPSNSAQAETGAVAAPVSH
jgi:hypothetical protein